jgi:hypothetical protein
MTKEKDRRTDNTIDKRKRQHNGQKKKTEGQTTQ